MIADSIDGSGSARYKDYLFHALCTGGKSTFRFNGRIFEFNEGDLMIVRKGNLLDEVRLSDDFFVDPGRWKLQMCCKTTDRPPGVKGRICLCRQSKYTEKKECHRQC